MPAPTADRRIDRAIETTVQQHVETLRAAECAARTAAEARSLLAGLGVPDALANPSSGFNLMADRDREAALLRLRTENRRLVRLARSGNPAYDLDRHIAVRRLVAAIEPPAPIPPTIHRLASPSRHRRVRPAHGIAI